MLRANINIKKETPFIILYGIFIALNIAGLSFFAEHFLTVNYAYNFICIFFLVIYEICINKTVSVCSLIALFLLSTTSIIIYIQFPSFLSIMLILIFLYVGRNVKFERIAKVTYIIGFVSLAIIVSCSYLGVIKNYVAVSGRKYIGFLYALYAPAILFNCITNYIYVHQKGLKLKALILFSTINLFFFVETGSRLSCTLTFAFIIISLFFVRDKNFLKRHRRILLPIVPIYIICTIISIYLVASYRSNIEWMYNLNELLGHRISLAQTSILRYGVSFFGSHVEWNGAGLNSFGELPSFKEYIYVDNLYLRVLQQYGLIFLILYVCLHTLVLVKCYRKKEYMLFIIFAILAVHGLIDDLTLFLHSNSFWLAIGSFLFSDKFLKSKSSENSSEVSII